MDRFILPASFIRGGFLLSVGASLEVGEVYVIFTMIEELSVGPANWQIEVIS